MSKSFDGAIALAQAIMADCDKPILDHLQKVHDHDMELADKAAYHRGFEDGQRSMDAEHRAVAMRLQMLRLNEGSHENLSAIARAVHPTEWSWTKGACANLLDKLIRLMGGVHDDPVPVAASGDAGCDDCHRRDGEAGRVTYDEPKSCKIAKTIKSEGECDGKMMESGENHQIEGTITDELREFKSHINAGLAPEMVLALRAEINCIADRIDEQEHKLKRQRDELRAELDELRGHSRTCPESGDGVSVSAPSASITDELRECVHTADRQYDDMPWYEMSEDSEADHTICLVTEGELLRVADSIDEQFKRTCEQHEAVLQKTIDEMAEFREHEAEYATAERDELTHDVEMWRDRAEDMRMERDELQAKLDAATHDDGEYKSKVELLLELILKDDRIEKLQTKLDAVREALDGQR